MAKKRGVASYLDAGYPILYIRTGEHERALMQLVQSIKDAGLGDQLKMFIWKVTTGLYPYGASDPANAAIASDFMDALNKVVRGEGGEPAPDSVYVFFNTKELLNQPGPRQMLRDAAHELTSVGSHIILIGCGLELPEELSDVVTFIDFDLPSREDIKALFRKMVAKYKESLQHDVTETMIESAAENATGLSYFKAENALSLSIVESGGIDIDLLRSEKQLAVKQSGVLEYIPTDESMGTLGGFDVLKDHVGKRRRYFEERQQAKQFGLRPPKGIMLVGIAGTGKSLSAKAVSAALNLPLYKFNVGAVFKGLVGASEAAVRSALQLAETVSPCVLLFDEMEKGFAGLESSGKTDSGVTSRVMGQILTWMQECDKPIYKIATCNTIRNLDAAMIRRGRWDAVFAVELPTLEERRDIFAIHLEKRGRKSDGYDLDALAAGSVDFVGAEIESVVDEALYVAFDDNSELTTEHLIGVCRTVVPIAKTDAEEVSRFRDWIAGRAMNVSSVKTAKAKEKAARATGRAIRTGDQAAA